MGLVLGLRGRLPGLEPPVSRRAALSRCASDPNLWSPQTSGAVAMIRAAVFLIAGFSLGFGLAWLAWLLRPRVWVAVPERRTMVAHHLMRAGWLLSEDEA